MRADLVSIHAIKQPLHLPNGVTQFSFAGTFASNRHLSLNMFFQVNDGSPVVRFRYELCSDTVRKFSKPASHDELTYVQTSFAPFTSVQEINLSSFTGLTHTYTLAENKIEPGNFEDQSTAMGPILAGSNSKDSFLVSYEHGSQVPDRFLEFKFRADRTVALVATRGNYVNNQEVGPERSFETIWFDTAAVNGSMDDLAHSFRLFLLRYISVNTESRKPYIFYNTWNLQERNKWWKSGTYLEPMTLGRMLEEIDVAYKMSIDVFVIDTGWYEKTGDWEVSLKRFPDGLKQIRSKLDGYGMKLGLWFGPTTVAVSSRIARHHPEWRASWNGRPYPPEEVWETEKSYPMCMVSDYSDVLADEIIRVGKELGVSYFKWDWDDLHHHQCNDPSHLHGTGTEAAEERFDSFRFQLPQRINRTAERITKAIPNAIIEFDITEEGRAIGLGFLAYGKYFLFNNGPYYFDYDVPFDKKHSNWNLFFNQGQARAWIARLPLTYDRWIPSVLMLGHFFPDAPRQWQDVNLASLILGGNGIWGNLTSVSDTGANYIGSVLNRYKKVREDIVESDMVTQGKVSSSPEIYEKISASGRGAIAVFATMPGRYEYVSKHSVADEHWFTEGVNLERDPRGRAKLSLEFDAPGAKMIFFGVK